MNCESAKQIVATYEKHGWKLRRILATAPAQDQRAEIAKAFPDTPIAEAEVDALWFARSSQAGREAWEIRLVAEQAYALFEAFEADESEEDREDARREMENKMREYARG
jgi:glycine cleavage system aminomethyltransferase T